MGRQVTAYFRTKIDDRMRAHCKEKGVSIYSFIADAVKEKLDREREAKRGPAGTSRREAIRARIRQRKEMEDDSTE